MDAHEFNLLYATEYNYGENNIVDFNPLHKPGVGTYVRLVRGAKDGGEYLMREQFGVLYMTFEGVEGIVTPTENGFDLIVGETVAKSFTRIIK
jgi:hypothetical protein